MLLTSFRFKTYFTGISEEEMQLLLDEAEVSWAGVRQMWGMLDETNRNSKRDLCMNYICAWYIADMFPKNLKPGIFSSGGSPLSHKTIDGVTVGYKNRGLPSGMEPFESNVFGLKALDMIINAPDMMGIHG